MAEAYTIRILFVVPANLRVAANNTFKTSLDTLGGERTFTVGLSATGNNPVSHYWAHGYFQSTKATVLASLAALNAVDMWVEFLMGSVADIPAFQNRPRVRVGPFNPEQVLTSMGLRTINGV
jgi:hypothetical protein